ncbi:MAG: hypothetical protein J6U98_07910 [Abditibacteriota bacterium]|nr:hypothetical protein [Abditibacteriota bacterium]
MQTHCKKCGAELHENQKVCIKCGEVTEAGGNFEYGSNRILPDLSKLPMDKIYYGLGALAFIIILICVICAMRVTPPDKICREWFVCMYSQNTKGAEKYMSDEYAEEKKLDASMTTDAQEYHTAVTEEGNKYTIKKYEEPAKDTVSYVIGIEQNGEKVVTLKKMGRKWKVCEVK